MIGMPEITDRRHRSGYGCVTRTLLEAYHFYAAATPEIHWPYALVRDRSCRKPALAVEDGSNAAWKRQ